ncbi:MAG TPA: oxygenase MpaB family protein [Jatrophihabitantaceae bacterium]|nr:oxygenase MpaB family protein [Jatrophihabitantaceae bacterium]
MSTADLGYFGPDSVTWRIHGEPVAMVGGLRALLLQALHPGAMRLLYTASNFQDDPWARLQRTVGYVATLSFAPRAKADAAAARVREVHELLGVSDPEQLAWVHLCLVDSFLAAGRASGLRLSRDEADRYVAEQQIAAQLVGVPHALVPADSAELADAIAQFRPVLRGTKEAREAARYVIAPPLPIPVRYRLPARAGWTTVSSLAVGLLPPWARRMYRLPPTPGAGLATAAGLRALRGAVRVLPARYREGPAYRDAKARAAAVG